MTHILCIDIGEHYDEWCGPNGHYLWLSQDLMMAEQMEPLRWVIQNAKGPWAWQIVDTHNNRVFNKYSERLEIFDVVVGIQVQIMFDSLDDALLFKLSRP